MSTKVNLDVNLVLSLVGGLISLAFSLWSSVRQVLGEDQIPDWQTIVTKNSALQGQIDMENT